MLILLPCKLFERNDAWLNSWTLHSHGPPTRKWQGKWIWIVLRVEITSDHKSRPPIEQLKDEFKTITQQWPSGGHVILWTKDLPILLQASQFIAHRYATRSIMLYFWINKRYSFIAFINCQHVHNYSIR